MDTKQEEVINTLPFKVSEINLNPSRSVELGPSRGWVALSAGIKIVLDEPTNDPKKIEEAYAMGRKFVNEEMKKQFAPYAKKKEVSK